MAKKQQQIDDLKAEVARLRILIEELQHQVGLWGSPPTHRWDTGKRTTEDHDGKYINSPNEIAFVDPETDRVVGRITNVGTSEVADYDPNCLSVKDIYDMKARYKPPIKFAED